MGDFKWGFYLGILIGILKRNFKWGLYVGLLYGEF